MLTLLPDAMGLSSSKLNEGMTLSVSAVAGCMSGDRPFVLCTLWPDTVEGFRVSLRSLGRAGWTFVGPLMEGLTPALMFSPTPSLEAGESRPSVMSDEVLDFRLLQVCLPCVGESVDVGLAITERRNLLAFSRGPASLIKTLLSDRLDVESALLGWDSASKTGWMQTRPGGTRRERKSL